jgi:outer membrane receptor protein involved in Fe transport
MGFPSLIRPSAGQPLLLARGMVYGVSILLSPVVSAQSGNAAQTVEIVGTSPLPGQGIDRNLLPYTSQVIRRGALDEAQADTTTDYLARRVPGAQVNDIQGSPFQGDLTFHGYRASGLLGASQGLSVYLDGVRINEPFGDVVNWDMIPEFAIQSMSLVPGANPAFGLNTLGGALSFTTASGLTAPGGRAELTLGSFGRKQLSIGYGHHGDDGWDQYVGGTLFDESGWRDHSAGHLGQALVKLGREDGDVRWSTSLLLGRSTLVGNGLTPAYTLDDSSGTLQRVPDLYAARRAAIYTYPDKTRNELAQWQFNLQRSLDADTDLSALVYLRSTHRDTLNGDTADAPEGDLNAVFNTTSARQSAAGLAASLARHSGNHQWQVGGTLDAARMRFSQNEQAGSFTADRGVTPGEDPAELSAAVRGHSWNLGLFATDTWRLAAGTHLTATLRANHASVSNTLTSVDDNTGDATVLPSETFRYNSLNPALGLTQQLGSGFTLFGNLARNARVPTVIELGCADPAEPCRLPAGLQSDPYLKQVRSTSGELGVRWRVGSTQSASLSAYRIDNRDDIVFGSVSATSQLGYFRNFARTRNEGVDAAWEARLGAVSVQLAYSYLNATYQASDTLRMSGRNVQVTPGMRMAGLPRDIVKAGLDWQATPSLSVGFDVQALSRRGVLGNEDGLVEDGTTDQVDLSLPGYALLNLRASWKPAAGWELFARIGNATNRQYESYGALAETVFDASGGYTGEAKSAVFVAPGAPRSFQVGGRFTF